MGPRSVECLRHFFSNLFFPLRGSGHLGGLCKCGSANGTSLQSDLNRFSSWKPSCWGAKCF